MIKEAISEAKYILVITHINPDADTISCSLALSNYLFENRKKHKVFNISKELPRRLDFIPRFDKITNQLPKFYDLVIYVDCADLKRTAIDIPKDVKSINIDHHQSNEYFADINIVDDTKSSCAEVLYELFEKENMNISKNSATAFYVGIYDDSVAFTTPRVDSRTFEIVACLTKKGIDISYISNQLTRRESLAKLRILPKILDTLELHKEGLVATVYLDPIWLKETGATTQECDDIVDMVLSLAVVDIVAYLRIKDDKVRVSLRSKNSDVSTIAKKFNGGGHKNAAGLSIDTLDIGIAKSLLLETV